MLLTEQYMKECKLKKIISIITIKVESYTPPLLYKYEVILNSYYIKDYV